MLRRRPVMRTMARTAVVAGTATAVSGRVARRQQARDRNEAETSEQQAQPAAYAPPLASTATAPTSVEQLTQLAALREQGVLTDAEFQAEKAKILGG